MTNANNNTVATATRTVTWTMPDMSQVRWASKQGGLVNDQFATPNGSRLSAVSDCGKWEVNRTLGQGEFYARRVESDDWFRFMSGSDDRYPDPKPENVRATVADLPSVQVSPTTGHAWRPWYKQGLWVPCEAP